MEGKSKQRCTIRTALPQALIWLFLLGQRPQRLEVSRREPYRWSRVLWSFISPPPYTHTYTRTSNLFCPGSTQRLLSDFSGQRFGQTFEPQLRFWICLKLPPPTNQETKKRFILSNVFPIIAGHNSPSLNIFKYLKQLKLTKAWMIKKYLTDSNFIYQLSHCEVL